MYLHKKLGYSIKLDNKLCLIPIAVFNEEPSLAVVALMCSNLSRF
jgi:hypothetical protein